MRADDFGDIGFADADAGIAQAVAKNFRHRTARPGDDRRHQFGHHDLRLAAEHGERRTQRKAHAEAADEHMRLCDLFDLLRRERRERGLRAREAAVHQLVGAEHDGELLAAAHQAEFILGAGNAGGVEFFPGNHVTACSIESRVVVRHDRTIAVCAECPAIAARRPRRMGPCAFADDDSGASLPARPHVQHVAILGAEIVDPAQPGVGIGAGLRSR